jgi:hypothetical protein
MKAAARANDFDAGPQPEVIRVAEDDARVEFRGLKRLEANPLHRPGRADGHEDGSLDERASRLQQPGARLAFACDDLPVERLLRHLLSGFQREALRSLR